MRLGLLTGGGDCAGLNAARRAVGARGARPRLASGIRRARHGLWARPDDAIVPTPDSGARLPPGGLDLPRRLAAVGAMRAGGTERSPATV